MKHGRVASCVVVGSGSSTSTPMIQCMLRGGCPQCIDAVENPLGAHRRTNPSLLLQFHSSEPNDASPLRNVLIDCGKTFREQALRSLIPRKVDQLHAILLTHDHADAVSGLDEVREFGKSVPVYADARTMDRVQNVFSYLFPTQGATGKGFVGALAPHVLKPCIPFDVEGVQILPIPVEHGPGYDCLAFVVSLEDDGMLFEPSLGRKRRVIAYISDISSMPDGAREIFGQFELEIVFLDMMSQNTYFSHFNTEQAVDEAARLGGRTTIFVGLSHSLNAVVTADAVKTQLEKVCPEFVQDGRRFFIGRDDMDALAL